jgi:hypothetical protein
MPPFLGLHCAGGFRSLRSLFRTYTEDQPHRARLASSEGAFSNTVPMCSAQVTVMTQFLALVTTRRDPQC